MIANITTILAALTPLVEAFEEGSVPYYIGGSVASSTYGSPRITQDVDVIADLKATHVRPLVTRLEETYYLDEESIRDAIRRRSSFNVIALDSMLKVDVFLPKSRAFDREEHRRARPHRFERGGRAFSMVSPEDAVLAKLEWYRLGGETSQRQWKDCVQVLQAQRAVLNLAYLQRWARVLGVAELLQRVLMDAGF